MKISFRELLRELEDPNAPAHADADDDPNVEKTMQKYVPKLQDFLKAISRDLFVNDDASAKELVDALQPQIESLVMQSVSTIKEKK